MFYALSADRPTGRWAADESLDGATVQLWFIIKPNRAFEAQIACKGGQLIKQSGNTNQDAAKACKLLQSSRKFFTTLLTASPPKCPNPDLPQSDWVKYRGRVWGQKVDRYFYPGPCRSQMDNFYSAFTLSRLLAPEELKRGGGPPTAKQKEEFRKAKGRGGDLRPSPDRTYPCPPGIKSTKKAPCRMP